MIGYGALREQDREKLAFLELSTPENPFKVIPCVCLALETFLGS